MTPEKILEKFHELSPWTRFDEWSGIWVETESGVSVCALFGEDQEADYKLLILRGANPADRYLEYRNGEWIPEFGLDFATTDGIKLTIASEQVENYESCHPGLPPEPLRLDEKQMLFEVLDAINYLVMQIDAEKLPTLGEEEEVGYHVWKVAKTWRAEVRELPEEKFIRHDPIEIPEIRIKRIKAAGLLQEGIWEASPFYLPVTRFQGNQEVYVQCAGVAERGMGLLGLVTLEAHANAEQETAEAILGSIEKQMRYPQFLIVKEEKIAEKLLPILTSLGIQLRLRRRLRELEFLREEMIEEFPDPVDDGDEEAL
jgi:hypothetical protein